jgi:predicted DNA-binding ribbon-helix-helix protein
MPDDAITPTQFARLQELARAKGVTVEKLVREILDEYIAAGQHSAN